MNRAANADRPGCGLERLRYCALISQSNPQDTQYGTLGIGRCRTKAGNDGCLDTVHVLQNHLPRQNVCNVDSSAPHPMQVLGLRGAVTGFVVYLSRFSNASKIGQFRLREAQPFPLGTQAFAKKVVKFIIRHN